MLSVCCLSGGSPGRLAALARLLRPVADEIVVALDERVDPARLGELPGLCDLLVRYPFAEPVERSLAWLHSLCRGDWVFRIDDDEVPGRALLDALARPDEGLTHAWVPRRWLWRDGWLDREPWAPDWQLRLVRPEAAQHPGRTHIPIRARGPHAYLEAPLYHLDLVAGSRPEREAKAARYDRERPGLRLGGWPLNAAYYLPEARGGLPIEPLPAADAALVGSVLEATDPAAGSRVPLPRATRAEIDALWAEAPLAEGDYRCRILLGPPPTPVAGEVRQVEALVTNLGGATWAAGPEGLPEVRLAYRFEGGERAGLRTPFPRPVGPGETVRVPISFEAPAEPGAHVLVVDLVHERRRWFGCEQRLELAVAPRRRALVLVGQPPGDASFDARLDEMLASLDPLLEPFLVGPRPEWLRDRFALEAAAEPPQWRPELVLALPAGSRRERLRLRLQARRLRRHAGG